jgi:hypothetical protein
VAAHECIMRCNTVGNQWPMMRFQISSFVNVASSYMQWVLLEGF